MVQNRFSLLNSISPGGKIVNPFCAFSALNIMRGYYSRLSRIKNSQIDSTSFCTLIVEGSFLPDARKTSGSIPEAQEMIRDDASAIWETTQTPTQTSKENLTDYDKAIFVRRKERCICSLWHGINLTIAVSGSCLLPLIY